jgi:exopolysaccharide/PEP-CTERM locus tyrosine autokinase
MSIVEKALQKAQAKQERVAATQVPQAAPAVAEEAQPRAVSPTPQATPREPYAARGGRVELDFDGLRAAGRLVGQALAHRTEEEFRRVKWPLLNAILGRDGATKASNNVVLVTSAIPGEGKTFSALNLALSLAREPDLQVLLVDGDVAQPALTGSLGLAARAGLTDLVANGGLLSDDVVCETSVDRLWILPAGSRRDNSPELLSSARMQTVIDELAGRMSPGVVIFDSPPVLATNEAQVLSRFAGQVLMVVRADFTEQRQVKDALALIDRSRPVSALLNRVEPSLLSRYYSHYYYGYGQGPRS